MYNSAQDTIEKQILRNTNPIISGVWSQMPLVNLFVMIFQNQFIAYTMFLIILNMHATFDIYVVQIFFLIISRQSLFVSISIFSKSYSIISNYNLIYMSLYFSLFGQILNISKYF